MEYNKQHIDPSPPKADRVDRGKNQSTLPVILSKTKNLAGRLKHSTPAHLRHCPVVSTTYKSAGKLYKTIHSLEKDIIAKALKDAGGNKSKAAEILGISRPLLYRKMELYGLTETAQKP